ncbi:MAG: MBL fold metallo-hydrolase, partial [Dehalococcoidales bacterium]|nr:MBL fold metallo-hydrolase [Dehalococcoidales bacterium]
VASVGLAKFVATAPPDVILHGGETISTGVFSFKVFFTPGHSPGHICLYEPDKKILLSGDHILPNITPHIGLHPQSGRNPLGDYINSLEGLKQLDTELVLPGHEITFTGLKQRIDKIIQHHQQRSSNILDKIKDEPKSAYQVATAMTWLSDKDGASWQKLEKWEKRSALLETLSHLEFMRFEGKAEKITRDSIIYYHQT